MLRKHFFISMLLFAVSSQVWAKLDDAVPQDPTPEEMERLTYVNNALRTGNEMQFLDFADGDDIANWLKSLNVTDGVAERISPSQIGPQYTDRLLVNLDHNGTNQRMYWFHNGQFQKWFVISGAKPAKMCRNGSVCVTPRGFFAVHATAVMATSQEYNNSPMPCAMFFHAGGAFAVHGTEFVGALGAPASHGCVRTDPKEWCPVFNKITDNGKNFQHNVYVQIVDSLSKQDLASIQAGPALVNNEL